jgi:hypothetical protein
MSSSGNDGSSVGSYHMNTAMMGLSLQSEYHPRNSNSEDSDDINQPVRSSKFLI